MTTPSTSPSATADEPPPYCESINVNKRYVRWAERQPHQNDLSFACDENNVKHLTRAADLESWYISMYARPLNVLPLPIFLSPGSLGQALAAQPTPNFRGYTLIGLDTESIMATDMKHFQFTVSMPADSTAPSCLRYVQLPYPNGMMFVFETFTATPEDWTALFSLVDSKHTIVVSFDEADDWAGIYALLGTQFQTDRQKKNKDPVVKAIHLEAYRVI
uniref:Uncharacterized protein n=1 Tax=Romanomermis culicivorax TaxID=13658 RepID=A0A915L561_ROMCU